MKKSTYKHFLAGLVMILLLTSVVSHQTYAAGSKINKKKVTLLVSQSFQLSVSGVKSKIRWSSSDKKIAKVTNKGKVTGKKPGKATISATVGSKTYKCKVTVKIGLSKKKVDLTVGDTKKIKLCGSKIKKVKTSNAKVATITKKGLITAVGEGNATITVTGKNKKKYKCKVSVAKPSEPPKNTNTNGNKDTNTNTDTNPKPSDKPEATKYYQVKFDSTGGNAIETQKIQSGKTASVPNIPSRDGFIFDHWELNGAAYDFSSPVTADITLAATWGSGDQTWENAKEVKQVIDVNIAPGVQTETQVIDTMTNRGFTDYDVIYDFTMDGEYCEEVETVNGSSAERPRYFTYFVSDSDDVWTIYSINGAIFAYPASFNLESDLGVAVLVSESEELTSYDYDTNKYYVTIPDESGVIVKVVDRIDAATLNSLTSDVLSNF